jgi:hypothetical protein
LEDCFTVNRLDIPRSLHRCLATSNIVDNPYRHAQPHRPGVPLASRHASALVGGRILGRRKIIPQDHGLSGSLALKAILNGSQPATRQAVA